MERGGRRTGRGLALVLSLLAGAAAGACGGGDPAPTGAGPAGARAGASGPEESGRRMALVVGNDAYEGVSRLENAVNDARAVAEALEDMGFAVERLENTTQERLERGLAGFAAGLAADDVALFYFAGHGMEVDQVNYLIPTDFDAETAAEVRFDAVSALDVQEMLRPARVAMLVFDACRNNPYRGFRSGGGGLAPMEARGTLIAYAAGAGELAADAAPGEENGLFTSKFVEALGEPGLTASAMFQRVRREVYSASNERQWPAVYDDLLADFVFRPAAAAADGPAAVVAGAGGADACGAEADRLFWESIRDSRNAADFEAYKRRCPGGLFVELADNRLAELRRDPDAGSVPAGTSVDGGGREDGPPSTGQGPGTGPSVQTALAVEMSLGLGRSERRLIQWGLRAEGFEPGVPDGLLGRQTRDAILNWQVARGAEHPTGYLDGLAARELMAAGTPLAEAERQRRAAAAEAERQRRAAAEAAAEIQRRAAAAAERQRRAAAAAEAERQRRAAAAAEAERQRQARTSIAGTVTDDTGGGLPGVTVEASSDALIEGSRVVFTDGTGDYHIIDLRPGTYRVVFTLPGFRTRVRDRLVLGAGVTLPLDVVMSRR